MFLTKFSKISTSFLLVFLCLAPALGQQHSVQPGINEYYQNPDFEDWVERFESEGREVYDQRHRIVEALGLRPGMTVADIGAGTGLYTLLFAPKVGPQGKVYAVDISDVFMENVARRAKDKALTNVETLVNTDHDTLLPAGSTDLAFLSDTYHHFEYPRDMLASIHRALRPGGELVIIDFRKQPGVSSGWVMGHVRADRASVIQEVEAAGFEFTGEEQWLRTNYFLRFKKRG